MTDAKLRDRLPYRRQCAVSPVAYSSFKRWKARRDRGEVIVGKAGPKKVRPLDLDALYGQIQRLSHRRRRTHGTTALYQEHRDEISRRHFQRMVTKARREANADMERIEWLKPGLVWSLDDSERGQDGAEPRLFVHSSQDMSSRYKFKPLVADRLAEGRTVADRLDWLFGHFGPPLFLKRDNGGNLNHQEVNRLLSEALVIPLNNPGYYPQYNGAMEHAQGEIKEELVLRIPEGAGVAVAQMAAEAAVHELNHKRRRILKGRTPCELFQFGRIEARRYNKRRRREVYDWIRSRAARVMAAYEGARKLSPATAWRIAAKTWLQQNGFIAVAARESVTQFSGKKGS
jgi:hypothetical protein